MIKECDESFDDELVKIGQNNGLTWLPWVGTKFDSSYGRVLVVAESHYSNEERAEFIAAKLEETAGDIYLTREVTEESCVRQDWRNHMVEGLYQALFRTSRLPAQGRVALWRSISFYNFIQRPMEYHGDVKERPQWDEFFKGWNTFVEVVKTLRPKQVIFVGTSAMGCFHEALSAMNVVHEVVSTDYANGSYSRTGWLEVEGNRVEVVSIRHTSSFFSWPTWNAHLTKKIPFVMKYLNELVFADSGGDRQFDESETTLTPSVPGLPMHLAHKPIIACDFQEINKTVSDRDYEDAKFVSIGHAQYNHDEITVKMFRRWSRWSRQSEEVPIQRLPYMMMLMLSAIYRLQNPGKRGFKTDELNEVVVSPADMEIMSDCFAKYGELIRKGLSGVKDLIQRIDIGVI